MSAIDSSEFPVASPARERKGRTKLRQSLRAMRDNAAAAYAPEDFNADIIVQRILWRRMFVINEPEAIRHVVLDNATNYTKSEVGRRLLEPGLGRGLLTSEGETWRRHRRIMAPAFDPRSVAGYAPIMPTYQGQISEDGLIDLVEYIKNMQTNYRVQQTLTTSQSNQAAPTTPGVNP